MVGGHRICGVIAAPTAAGMMELIRLALRHTRTLELRLDWLESERQVALLLPRIHALSSRATLIVTCRRREAGGRFGGNIAGQLARLSAACALGCQWCDLEIETAGQLHLVKLREFLSPSRLLISLHDFRRTPPGLHRTLRRLEQAGAHAVKIATACRSLADSVRVLSLTRGRRHVVAVPMGELGLPARVLALREGSALAYASVGTSTAPGQLSLQEMTNLYRAHRMDRATRVFGVIGNPVAHSLSPLLHNTGFVKRGVNAVYLPFLVRDLPDFLAAIEPLGIAGFSVTLPHKEKMLRHLDDCDAQAAAIGAVNTVLVRNGRLLGYNTDAAGILISLQQFYGRGTRLAGKRVLIFGAGGAARAAAVTLARSGAAVYICARRHDRARALARIVRGEAIARRHMQQNHFDVIINATPVGMHPNSGQSPLNASELDCGVVFDLVYRPRQTKLLRLAARRGIKTISGVEMFLQQGFAQWKIWMQHTPPQAPMRAAVVKALESERENRRRKAASPLTPQD